MASQSKIARFKKQLRSMVGIIFPDTGPDDGVSITEVATGLDEEWAIQHPDRTFSTKNRVRDLLNNLNPHIADRKDLHQIYQDLAKNHLVESILTKVMVDILHRGRHKGDPLITVEYPDDELQKTMVKILEDFEVEKNLSEILFDGLLFGEYYLSIDFVNSEFDDIYDYTDILPVYAKGNLSRLYHINKAAIREAGEKNAMDVAKETFVVSLQLPGSRIRLKVKDRSGSKFYLKVPSPFIPRSTISLIKSLELVDKLVPISQLLKIDKGQMVSMSVPPGTPINQMFDVCREFERTLNARADNMSFAGSMEDILESFGKYKVIPVVGGNKAQMDIRDLPAVKDIDFNDLEYLISTIANRLGVPIEYIVSGQEADEKGKKFYLLRLSFIRNSLANSVKDFLIKYMQYRKTSNGDKLKAFDKSKLVVKFPEVPGINSLEHIDYMDGVTSIMSNVQRLIEDTNRLLTEIPPEMEKDLFLDILNKQLEPVLGKPLYKLGVKTPPPEENL